MSLIEAILRKVIVEWPARGKVAADYRDKLKASGTRIQERIAAGSDTPNNHKTATHIIGIERWAQQHLQALIDDTTHQGEYNPHRPARDTAWSDLAPLFAQTRAETLALLDSLAAVPPQRTSQHNSFGDLTAVQWLQYIDGHGAFEARRIK